MMAEGNEGKYHMDRTTMAEEPKKVYVGAMIHTLVSHPEFGVLKTLLNGENNKIVVFTHHQQEIDKIYELLKTSLSCTDKRFRDCIVKVDGKSGSPAEQSQIIESFNKEGSTKFMILLINTQCGKTGLNLQSANWMYTTVVEPCPSTASQISARLYRQGQTRLVTWVHLSFGTSFERTSFDTQTSRYDSLMVKPALDTLNHLELDFHFSVSCVFLKYFNP